MVVSVMLRNKKMVSFRFVNRYFSQCDNIDLHCFDWIIAGRDRISDFMTVFVSI